MKKRLILGAALIVCTVVLTLTTGLAQAFVGSNQLYASVCRIGPNGVNADMIVNCPVSFPSRNPRIVLCQTRNSPLEPVDFPDQFACQVIRTSPGIVRLRIRRIDNGSQNPIGWGQDLRVNLLVVN